MIFYEEDGDEVIACGMPCPECGSTHTEKDALYGFWKCEDCSTAWAFSDDDPDWEDLEPCQ